MNDVTRILSALGEGDPQAAGKLLILLYDELRTLAAQRLAREKPGQTLQATALVHEAYLRLVGGEPVAWNNRGHFFAAAAEAMRRILVEKARCKQRVRHGGDYARVALNEADLTCQVRSEALLDLNEALEKLAGEDNRKAQLVKLRYFAGLSLEEAAELLGISAATAKRDWRYAKAFLRRELDGRDDSEASPGIVEEKPPA